MSDMLLQLRITADGKVAVQEVGRTADAMRDFQAQTKRTSEATDDAKKKSDAWVAALLRKKATLGMTWSEMKKYEASQLALTDAERKHASAVIDSIDRQERFGTAAEKVGRVLGGLVATALSAGAAMATVITKEAIQAATEAEQANLKVAAVLKATGYAAGLTAKDLDDLAESMAASTKFDDEAIKNASAILLTFRSVSKASFGDAMMAAADLASVMGTDLNSAVLMIGKALEQPEHGLTALTRAGVQFSDAQKEMIKDLVEQGRKAEAAKLILQELKSQGLDGVAQAMNTGLGKATSDLKKGWNELLEEIGRTDAIGGTATRYMSGLTQIMKDLQDQIAGTSDRFRNFFKSEEFLGSTVYQALRGLGMNDPYATPSKPAPRVEVDHAAELAAQDGRAIQAQKERIALERTRAKAAEEAASKEAAAYAKVVQAAGDYLASLEKQLTAIGATTEQKIMLEAATRSLTLKTDEERKAFLASATALAHRLQVEEDAAAAKKKAADDAKKIVEIEGKRLKALKDGTEALQRDLEVLRQSNDEFGLSREAIEAATLAKMEATLANLDFADSTWDEIDALEKRVEIQRQIVAEAGRGERLRDQASLYDEISSRVANIATGISKWTDEIKNFGRELAAILVKRWVLNLVAGVTGSGALAAQAAGVGQGTLAGAASSAIGNYAGSAAASALGYAGLGGVGDAAAGYIAQSAYLAGASEAAPIMATLAGDVGALLAYIPVWGWIAAGVVAIAAWVGGRHKGGPKVGGSFQGGFDSGGRFTGEESARGTDNGRFYTPNQADSEVRQMVTRYAAGYFGQLRALGGTSTGASFGLGFDSDPQGTARSRVSNSVIVGGREVYRVDGREVDDKEITEQLALEMKRGILAGLQNSNLEEGIRDILKTLDATVATSEAIDNVMKLAEAYKNLDDIIAEIEGTPAELAARVKERLDTAVTAARDDLTAALDSGDAGQILAAEQRLQKAVLDRYNSELSMIRSLQEAIAQAREQAYQFAMTIGQRINSVGGSRDLGALSLTRATTLRTGIGGNTNLSGQVRDLNSYVGAIDNWYNARRSQIERQVAAEQAAQQAIASAQQAAAQVRIAQLQDELGLAQQFQGVVDRTRQLIDQMRLTGANPLAVSGRLGLATGDAESLRNAYGSASGAGRADAANRYVDALQARLGLAQEAFQRPSPEYQAIYNEIIAELTRVQGDAQTEAERAIELQQQIVALQEQANSYGAAIMDASAAANDYLDALNAEALDYYTWAEAEGTRLYGAQERHHQEQLDAITGGMDVELYIAQRQRETVDELKQIKELIRAWAAANGASTPSPGDGDIPEGDTGNGTNALSRRGGATVVLNLDGKAIGAAVIPAIDRRIRQSGTVIKRAIENA